MLIDGQSEREEIREGERGEIRGGKSVNKGGSGLTDLRV